MVPCSWDDCGSLQRKRRPRSPSMNWGRRSIVNQEPGTIALFLGQNRIFHTFPDSKLQRSLGGYLNRFAGRWVPTLTGFSF